MFNKIREKKIIREIRKTMTTYHPMIKYLTLNTMKTEAALLLVKGLISDEFYINVFCGGTAKDHWSDVNKNFIINF